MLVRTNSGTTGRPLTFTSVYMSGETPRAPPHEFTLLVEYVRESGSHLVVGCNSNAHNTVLGVQETNTRVERIAAKEDAEDRERWRGFVGAAKYLLRYAWPWE